MEELAWIDQIPQSVLTCIFHKDGTSKEVSVTGLMEGSVRLRMTKESYQELSFGKTVLQFRYFDLLAYAFLDLKITKFLVVSFWEKEDFVEVSIQILEKEDHFLKMFQFVTNQYVSFVRAKMDPYDEMHKLSEYPFLKDFEVSDSYQDAMKDAMDLEKVKKLFYEAKKRGLETGIVFHKELLKRDESCFFLSDRIYLGDPFCFCHCPKSGEWEELVKLCKSHGKKITIQLPFVSQEMRERVDEMLSFLKTICDEDTELVLNDWGSVLRYQDMGFCMQAGILLWKARKDPRAMYRNGFASYQKQYETPQFATEIAGQFMERMHISGVETDVLFQNRHGCQMSYHFPLYQTNTSSFCTMRGLIFHQDRGKQYPVLDCERFCETHFFAYPKHLSMVGMGNTLFGIRELCEDLIEKSLLAGVHRIVYNGLRTGGDGTL